MAILLGIAVAVVAGLVAWVLDLSEEGAQQARRVLVGGMLLAILVGSFHFVNW